MFWSFWKWSGWKRERKLGSISFPSFIPCFKLLYEITTKNVVKWRRLQYTAPSVTCNCWDSSSYIPSYLRLYIHTFTFSTSFISFINNISLRSFQSQAFKNVQCSSIFYLIVFCYQWFYSLTSVLFFWISVATRLFI